jgi:hypothetical protein
MIRDKILGANFNTADAYDSRKNTCAAKWHAVNIGVFAGFAACLAR